MEGNYLLSGWNVTQLGSAVLGGGSLPQPSFSCGHIPGVSLGQPRSFFHTLVPAPAGSGEGDRDGEIPKTRGWQDVSESSL